MFDEFDDDDFVELAGGPAPTAGVILSVVALGRKAKATVQFSVAEPLLAEIVGPRFGIAFAVSKRSGNAAFRIKAGPQERYESMTFGKRTSGTPRRLLRCPAPADTRFKLPIGTRVEPEYFVDARTGTILVEVPELRKAAPVPQPAPTLSLSRPVEQQTKPTVTLDEETEAAIAHRMREMITGGIVVPADIGGARFTVSERHILAAVLAHPTISRQGLLEATHDGVGDDERDDKIIDVYLSKMRARLAPLQIEIINVGGGVYRMPLDSKTRLRKLIGEG